MFSLYRRHSLVLALLALTGSLGVVVGMPERVPPLPAVTTLLAHSGWSVDRRQSPPLCTAPRPSFTTAVCVVRDRQGTQAQLVISAASVQKMVHWSGALGFEGAGYQTTHQGVLAVRLDDGQVVPATVFVAQRLGDRELAMSAVVAPGYIAAHTTDHLLRDAWDVIRGHSGPYFVVRTAITSAGTASDPQARTASGGLLAAVLARLSQVARQG